jgi:hypothetical protein
MGQFEQALVISNDTDLVEPIRIATAEAKKRVGIVAPRRHKPGVIELSDSTAFDSIVRHGYSLNEESIEFYFGCDGLRRRDHPQFSFVLAAGRPHLPKPTPRPWERCGCGR